RGGVAERAFARPPRSGVVLASASATTRRLFLTIRRNLHLYCEEAEKPPLGILEQQRPALANRAPTEPQKGRAATCLTITPAASPGRAAACASTAPATS